MRAKSVQKTERENISREIRAGAPICVCKCAVAIFLYVPIKSATCRPRNEEKEAEKRARGEERYMIHRNNEIWPYAAHCRVFLKERIECNEAKDVERSI